MYLDFFHLQKPPFSIVPNPDFLLLTSQHRGALAHLTFSTHTDGIVVLTGEAGTGKTTVIRTFLEQQSNSVNTAVIIHPQLPALQMLQAICQEFAITYDSQADFRELLDALWQFLIAAHAENKRNVLIIDEAHNLSAEVMEAIRMLTNLETSDRKLLQIVLVGQQELIALLNQPQLRQIKQRVIASFYLQPMSVEVVFQYIQHRLHLAGAEMPIFSQKVCKLISKKTHGIPRLVNRLCDRTLILAFSRNQKTITTQLVRMAAKELPSAAHENDGVTKLHGRLMVILFVVLCLAVTVSGYIGYQWYERLLVAQAKQRLPLETQEQDKSFFDAFTSENGTSEQERAGNIVKWHLSAYDDLQTLQAQIYLFSLWNKNNIHCGNVGFIGMACLPVSVSYEKFIQLNTPAIVNYNNQAAVVVKAAGGQISLWIQGKEKVVSEYDLRAVWSERVIYIVPVPTGFIAILEANTASLYIRWIISKLVIFYRAQGSNRNVAELGNRLQHNNYYFDNGLLEIIKDFQQTQNLAPDGVFGVETFLRLQQTVNKEFLSLTGI